MKYLVTSTSTALGLLFVSASFQSVIGAEESIYGNYEPEKRLTPEEQQGIVATLTVLLFVLMAMEVTSPEVLFLIALIIVIMCEILTLKEGLAGFANNALITIGTLFLVVGAVERSHVVDWLARKTFGTTGSTTIGKIRMYCTCFSLSIFFNNTPLVAMLMPVVKDWGRMRGIGASQLLMPLSYAVLAGSFVTMIGTSTNLTVQGLMQADRGYSFTFFSPAPFGFPLFAILLLYMTFVAPYLLPHNKSGLIREARDKAGSLIAEVYVSSTSPAIGKSVGDMASSLGVAPSSIIKIRRQLNRKNSVDSQGSNNEETKPKSIKKSTSSSILDKKYLKKAAQFWYNSGNGNEVESNNAFENSDGYKSVATDSAQRIFSVAEDAEEGNANNNDSNESSPAYVDIIAPPHHELVGAHDVIFISSAQDVIEKMMKSIMGESKGLRILTSDVMALPGFGTEVIECVVSDTNPFVGKQISEISGPFAEKYGAAIVTVRGKEWEQHDEEEKKEEEDATNVHHIKRKSKADGAESRSNMIIDEENNGGQIDGVAGEMDDDMAVGLSLDENNSATRKAEIELTAMQQNPAASVSSIPALSEPMSHPERQTLIPNNGKAHPHHVVISDHRLSYGDIILCVTNEKQVRKLSSSRDFFVVSTVGALPKPLTWYTLIPVILFIVMLVIVALEYIDICPAALALTAIFFMGGWIHPDDITTMVDIRLLMLLGTSLSFATSMTKSGLALKIAETISNSNPSPLSAMLLVYALTLAITELISNNAAAALMYPIAVGLADQLKVSFKPFAMCVLIASTAGFCSPIGYQTHLLVWGPGGYRFKDFVIFGIVPDVIYWIGACLLIPLVYPF